MKKHIIAGIIFAASLALDIITKQLVITYIGLHERIDVIGSFVQFTLLYNRGGLFGIMQGYQKFFLIVSIIVLGLLIVYYIIEKEKTMLFCSSMALIMSGAIGNILDRLIGREGVVDFIYIGSDNFYRYPAFNIADSVIVVGAAILLIYYFKMEKKRKEN
jgi:signal peptidase II